MTTENDSKDNLFPNTEAQQMLFGSIMMELMQSERFVTFINTNFDIQTATDPESKEVMIRVIECPPEVVMERIKTLAGADGPAATSEEPKPKKAGKKLIAPPNTSPSKIVENKMKKKIIDKAVKLAVDDKKIIV